MSRLKPMLFGLMGAAWMGLASLACAAGDTRIAVLGFELNDLAGVVPTPQAELERTASVAPLLRNALSGKGGYTLVAIDSRDVDQANLGFGYLFDHADEAAALGRRFGADWVLVGRVHKPSFLFAYLKVHLVNVESGSLAGDYVVEVKGGAKKVTEHGVARLADQIEQTFHPGSAR
jgi:hypothetical protein